MICLAFEAYSALRGLKQNASLIEVGPLLNVH